MQASPSNAGFTLIELLVAMVITVLIGTSCYGVLHTMLASQAAVEERNTQLEALQNSLLLMQYDLMQATPRTATLDNRKVPPYTLDIPQTLSFHRQNWRNPMNDTRSALARIRYNFVRSSLIRDVWLITDYDYTMPTVSREITSSLKDAQFKSYTSSSSASNSNLLPSATEITLTYLQIGTARTLVPMVEAP